MSKKVIPIKYTSRDFNSIKSDLVEHAKRYYSNTFSDFNDASFGSLMLDSVAYVGDILSFYLDYQANESYLETAVEFQNVLNIGRQLGYKFSDNNSSTGIATFYISVPANQSGLGPDLNYAPVLKKGSTFSTSTATKFILNEDVRFDNPFNETRVSIVDDATGRPTFYAIKARGTVISGVIESEFIQIGEYEKFKKILLSKLDIVELISVFDQEGNEYYEVDYLGQNIIYKSVTNRNISDSTLAKEILKPVLVPRRFVVNRNLRSTTLQFGASSDIITNDNQTMLAEPSIYVLDKFGRNYISSDSFDPTKLSNNDKFGVAPSNTVLTVTYRHNSTTNGVNFAANSLTEVISAKYEFMNENSLLPLKLTNVRNSLEVNNESQLLGDVTVIDTEELKRRIENSFAAQNRAVTEKDYKALVYSMPNKFGSIKRVSVYRDENAVRRNLNIYVLCENQDGFLTEPNLTVKNNLKTWLNKNKMINDSIDILNGKVVNYGINFTALGNNNISKYDILTNCINQLKNDFALLPDFGETFFITSVFDSLKKVEGVIDVISVTIEDKVGNPYSDAYLNIKKNISSDGRYINVPKNVVMELKYPNTDIKGSIL
jgi:hypothetical protein